jgi:glycosyltransferase involved in cell wall biosynthesis
MQAFKGRVSVVIPALNEQCGVEKTIASIPKLKICDSLGYDLEILVIDGDSTDLTREAAQKMGARVIVEKQRGYGRAYKTGFSAAKGDIIVTLDADNTYPAESIPDYIQELNEKDIDFITINRFSSVNKGAMSFIHIAGNKILSFVMRLLYRTNIKDSQSGMWIMKKNFLYRITLNSDDMSMSEEIKIIAFRFFNSIEIDGQYFRRTGRQKIDTMRDGWRNLKYLFEYRKLLKSAISTSNTTCSKYSKETDLKVQ